MKYRIVGNTMPAVEIMFDSVGESVFTQSGGMTWMSDGIAMATNTRGGLMKGIGRMFAGRIPVHGHLYRPKVRCSHCICRHCGRTDLPSGRQRHRRDDLPEGEPSYAPRIP